MFPSRRKRYAYPARVLALVQMLLFAVPAAPLSARPQSAVDASSVDASACGLRTTFLRLHQTIDELGSQAHEAGAQALHLRRTARRRPYKRIESEWASLREDSESALQTVGRLMPLLDELPDDPAKGAASDLAAADQKALENILDYGHAVVFYQRSENNASFIFAKQVTAFTFGLNRSKGRSYTDTAARQFLDWRYTEIADSFRSLKLPEYRYGKLCNEVTARPAITIGSACELSGRLARAHAVVLRLNSEAIEAGEAAKRLHHTSLWRPYKHVEYDWYDILSHIEPALETLSEFPVALDDVSDNEKKRSALELTATYQNALLNVLNYAHWAVYDERVENLAAANLRPDVPTFGQFRDYTKSSQSIFGRLMLDARLMEPQSVVFMVRIPEYRYAKACATAASRRSLGGADACTFIGRFLLLRKDLRALGRASETTGEDALRIRHTSRRLPYRRVEYDWNQVAHGSASVTRELADLLFALDTARDGAQKQAALNLASTYQTSLDHFLDYATYAVGYQRAEHALSSNFAPSYFNYGVTLASTTMNRDTIMRGYFENRYTENADAFRAFKLPEHHYLGLCGAPIPEPLVAQVSVR